MIRATKAIGIVGFSGAGKTTLAEKLIARLSADGVRVSAVKHAHHNFVPDVRGKDSDRMRAAGALQTLVCSPDFSMLVTVYKPPREPVLQTLLNRLDPSLADVVFVEGLRGTAYPKIEVFRAELGHPLLASTDPHIIAVATDKPDVLARLGLSCPVLPLDDADQVTDFVRCFLRQSQTGQGGNQMNETTPPAEPAGTNQVDDLRSKLEEQLRNVGKHIDDLSERFQKAAHEAKANVDADLGKLKEQHKEEFEQLQKLQTTATESWSVFQKKLDQIAKSMSTAVEQVVDQAANALGIGDKKADEPGSQKTDAAQSAQETPPAIAAGEPAPSDAPGVAAGEPAPSDAAAEKPGASPSSPEADKP